MTSKKPPNKFHIVTGGPISRQRQKYAQATIEKVLEEVFSM
jgi:hypothetical protein